MTTPNSTTSPTLPSGVVYDKLKLTAQLILPALAALYFGLSQIWNLPAGAEVSGTVSLINVFVGVIVVWLKSLHNAAGPQYDGYLTWEDHDEGSALRLTSVDLKALEQKGEILMKVTRPETPPTG
jgi:Putative phage holin Dp-1